MAFDQSDPYLGWVLEERFLNKIHFNAEGDANGEPEGHQEHDQLEFACAHPHYPNIKLYTLSKHTV